ncbi:hypothetical protein Gogos_019790 [Gossypium gossypioides]|uniref:Uncharacterized protein n=1 Tax=Gossypium gossypioides TaxID=34282 RepID=A0A7J9D7H2_GOSGO|nr:hypothetical protein [Gossypium gossypioides]
MMRSSSFFTLAIEICLIYLTQRWINTCFVPSPSFGILLTVVSLLGEHTQIRRRKLMSLP